MARSYHFRSYAFIGLAALSAFMIILSPTFQALGHPLDFGASLFRLIDVTPAALHEIVSALFGIVAQIGRSSEFMFVSASCLTLAGLFAFAARSEVRGSPASIAIGL